MKKSIFFFFAIIISNSCYAQISYEKGYYIDNANQKINCLIKNIDWKNNPIDFEYKLSDSAEAKNANIKSIKEFGVSNVSKYIRNTVKIDRSPEDINNLSKSKEPIFKEEQLFLKVLVEGKANLYLYEDGNLKRYFYNKENANIEQLVFKSYKTSNSIRKNNQFRQQLLNELNCSTTEMDKVKSLNYKRKSLLNFFTEYNICVNSDFINYDEKLKRDLFNLSLRPRLKNSSLAIQRSIDNYKDTEFANELGIGFGIEAEFILPFNKNKWAILVEPTYQNFKSKKITDNVSNVSGGKLITTVDYSSIEIPVSLRHYFFLNKESKIFINASSVFDISLKSLIEFKRADNSVFDSLEIQARNNFAFGIGYKRYDKYSLEIRFQTSREVLGKYIYWTSGYTTLAIILGYSIY